MTLPELTEALDEKGVRLSLRLVVDAQQGVLTPDLLAAPSAHKALLMQRIVREVVWDEMSTRRWGPAIDDPTPGLIVPASDP